MKASTLFLLSLLLFVSLCGAFAEAETEQRREPFKPLIGQDDVIALPPPPIENPALLQKFATQQLRVTGILLGSLGTYATVLAPDGKTYMLAPGTLVGKYGGKVTAITENTVQVKETRSFLVKAEGNRKEHAITLSLNPLQEDPRPGSRFVVLER